LKQADAGTAVGEACRKAGISEATFYNWRKKCAGLMPSEMKRLRQLEAIAPQNAKKESGGEAAFDRRPAIECNDVWAMDFLHDQLYDGRKIRVLAIVDTFTRYSPALDVRQAYRGADVVETLERACKEIGYPKMIRCDNGSEFVSRDLDLWAYQREVTLDFSRPGKPTDNAFVESFNGKFRAECLNAHWFMGLDDARRKCETWRRHYNEERPHSAIGQKCPIELMIGSAEIGPR
jgi:putative transposase